MKYIWILLFPIIMFANTTYKEITTLNKEGEGTLTRITKINNETLEFFKVYVDNGTANNISKKCKVKTKEGKLSLSTGKPFLCNEKYYEFVNKEVPKEYEKSVSHLSASFFYEFLLKNIGKLLALVGFMLTFIIYMMTHKGEVLLIGVVTSIIIGAGIGLGSIYGSIDITGYSKAPYSKKYLIKYYDDIEKKEGHKVFRKGFVDN